MMDTEWLKHLKPGDKVVVTSGRTSAVAQVKAVTPTGIIKLCGERYARTSFNTSGLERGRNNGYYRVYLEEPTQEKLDFIRREKFVSYILSLKGAELEYVPVEDLQAFYMAVRKARGLSEEND